MNEKVTAIITTHNRLEYLKKAIMSVKKQTYRNIEIIVVDDNSDSDTAEYCNNVEEIKYIKIKLEEHKNGNYARNIGLRSANGKYVAFLDDDDEWLETKIEKQVNILEKNVRLGAVYVTSIMDFNDGMYTYNNVADVELKGDCSKKCLYNIITSTSAIMFRKDALEKIGGFDENVNFWQDTELVVRLCQEFDIDYIDEPLIIYRERFNDKKRLSNNIEGYKLAIEYINQKHKDIIDKLSDKEKKQRKVLIYNDMAVRCAKKNDMRNCRKYLYLSFKTIPSIKSFIKFLLNYTWIKKIKVLMEIQKYKSIKLIKNFEKLKE
ncbi:MAG: glycosyltransferase family 2 protein [Clostridia bacterium]|nr:glycosyltransferase family 2 protein [Clostridia bacterium]